MKLATQKKPEAAELKAIIARLPKSEIRRRSRNYSHRPCPYCGKSCYRDTKSVRRVRDIGNVHQGRPVEIEILHSKHRCSACKRYFNADMTDLAPPGSDYTKRVVDTAVSLVVDDLLPYRQASWRMWESHCVFVPFATIQNWVEDAGKKKRSALHG